MGGFVDGIVIHQVLQWHHMLSHTDANPMTTVAGLEANTLADGFFHVGTWIVTFIGLNLAIKAWQQGRLAPPWRFHLGLMFAGWGLFNLVEGLINHQLLGLHHLRDDIGSPLSWDIGFLIIGAVQVIVGFAAAASASEGRGDRPPEPFPVEANVSG